VGAYEAALAVENQRPRYLTNAYLDLPFVVAVHGIKPRYEQSLRLLEQHQSRPMFPVDHFRWHAAHALISLKLGRVPAAREHAHRALNAAAENHSGFRYHPSIGLAGKCLAKVLQQLSDIVA
jgi:hypothetical protein